MSKSNAATVPGSAWGFANGNSNLPPPPTTANENSDMNDTINGDFELFQPDPQDFPTELRRTEAPTEVPFVLPPISRTEVPTEDLFVLPELPEYHWDEPAVDKDSADYEYSIYDFEPDQMPNFDSHDGPSSYATTTSLSGSSGGFPFGGFVPIAAVSILGSAILFLVVSCVRKHKHPDERRNSRNSRRRSLPWGHDSAHATTNSTAMAHAYAIDSPPPMATAVAIDSGGAGGFSGGGFSGGGGDCGGGGGF